MIIMMTMVAVVLDLVSSLSHYTTAQRQSRLSKNSARQCDDLTKKLKRDQNELRRNEKKVQGVLKVVRCVVE